LHRGNVFRAPLILLSTAPGLIPFPSSVLAHATLNETLNVYGMLGCLMCITGSLSIALHAPPERHLGSVIEVWQLAMQPGTRIG